MRLTRTIWHLDSSLAGTELANMLLTLDSVFALKADVVSKDNHGDVIRLEADGQAFFVKRFLDVTGIRSWLWHSRLRMEAQNQRRFKEWGLNAATVVGYGEDYMFSRTFRGVLITAGISNSRNLEDIAKQHPELLKDTEWLHNVMQQVADATALLHRHNFCHNDLFLRNLLIQGQPSGPKLYFIDCPSGSFWFGPMLYKRRVKDIACLDKHASRYLTKAQRLRFMLCYLNVSKLSDRHRRFVRDVLEYPERRMKRKQRQRRLRI